LQTIDEKYYRLLDLIAVQKDAAVAFSGGVDSSFLCHAAAAALGRKALAVTILSPMLPESERNSAAETARLIGIDHIFVEENAIDEEVAANSRERCYFCKKLEFAAVIEAAERRGIHTVLDGSNLDDLGDYRPGLKALKELGVLSPLREAGLVKEEIRELSRRFKLPTWDKPAFACLPPVFPTGKG
jgi:uncharacterized protein